MTAYSSRSHVCGGQNALASSGRVYWANTPTEVPDLAEEDLNPVPVDQAVTEDRRADDPIRLCRA